MHHRINTFLKFTPGAFGDMAFTQPWYSASNAKHRCLIDERWTVCVSLPLFPVCAPAITAVHWKISCCVWAESDWQQAANSQTAAEMWFTGINRVCLGCCNVLRSTLSWSDGCTELPAEGLADRLPDPTTIQLYFSFLLSFSPCKPLLGVYTVNCVKKSWKRTSGQSQIPISPPTKKKICS